ncbi:MAG: Polysaccharide biosynthesis protein [Microgenomates group bacterium GW2011_GWA2_46_7]|nr:MAG: Polysaccharide biosynthesis protein [Microgenomates group bacterium GW2011_GWA2_46_7]KKU45896.1 MAG: Polysaccharide biosynthesis protein [Microgenomates group bacterium GW2011_GWC2_46_7]
MHYSLARATTWNIASYLYLILASLVSTPILVNHLGLVQFGQYSLIFAAIILVSSLNLGLPQAVTRALARDHEFSPTRQTLWATSSMLFLGTGFVAGIIAVILTLWLHLTPLILLEIFALVVINNLVAHYSTLPQAEGHFGYYNAKTFIVGTGNTLLAAYLAWIGQGVPAILSMTLACYLLTLAVLVYFSLKYFPRPRAGIPSLPVARALITFGLKNQAGTLTGQVQSQYGKYLLSSLSPLKLSAYVVAIGLVQKLAGGVVQIATALYPASARSAGNLHLRRTYHVLQLGLFILALLGIGLYQLIGLSFLTWWLHSPELVPIVHTIMQILVWYFAILILSPLASSILDGHGRPGLTSLFTFATAAIEIILALILFPHYGLLAPVYSALVAIVLTTPALLIVTERVLNRV